MQTIPSPVSSFLARMHAASYYLTYLTSSPNDHQPRPSKYVQYSTGMIGKFFSILFYSLDRFCFVYIGKTVDPLTSACNN